MKTHLLKKTLITASVTTLLTACGGDSVEGYDPNFSAPLPVAFSNAVIAQTLTEEMGIQRINLVEGATVNGSPATGAINVTDINITVNKNYVTPQIPTGSLPNQTQSPFVEEGGFLVVDTDMFADRLSTCDTRDVRGARDENNNVIPDGIPDNPEEVTYIIDYAVDNGAPIPAGGALPRRTLELTINAVFDAVDGITANDTRVLLGAEQRISASVLPEKACEQDLIYSVADETIATIDADGNIETRAVGTTDVTITSVSDSSQSMTISLEVFSEFTIQVSNQDFDDNSLPLGTKKVPACTSAGFYVEPTPASGDILTGEYVYDFTTDNINDFPVVSTVSIDNGALGRVTNTGTSNVGFTYDVTVDLMSGNTGQTDIANVESQTLSVEVVNNLACAAAEIGVVRSDYALDGPFQVPGPGALRWAPNVGNGGTEVSTVAVSDVALSGTAMEISRVAPADDPRASFMIQGDFNTQGRNYNNTLYGKTDLSIGRQFKYSVWVKLATVPTSEVTLRQRIVPWKYADVPTQQPGFNYLTRFPGSGNHSAVLLPTTDWQLVELIDEVSNTDIWTVPESWNIATPVFQVWEVEGLLPGQSIILDEYSIVEIQ